ncbi:MAG: TonB-dependent receptor, partial [Cytophagaceae bacterium]
MHSIDRSMCDVPLRACRAQLGMPGTRRRREISLSQMQTTAPCSAFRPTGKTDRQPMDCCCRRISQTCINVGRHVTGPEGNPGLAPELSDNVEVGYSTYIKGSVINASFFYRNTNAIIESVFIPGQKLTTFLNVGTNETFGMNIFGSYNPLPKWTLMANFGLNSYEVNDPVQNISTGTFVNYNVFGRSAIAFNGGWNTEMFVV